MAEVPGKEINLWVQVANKCLRRASKLMDEETAAAGETAAAVKTLVETAIEVDKLNLLWLDRSRLASSAPLGPPFWKREEEN